MCKANYAVFVNGILPGGDLGGSLSVAVNDLNRL